MRDNDATGVVLKVFGVVSGGRERSCLKDDLSYNVNVGQFGKWIETVGEGRLSPGSCSKPVSSADVQSRYSMVHLDEATPAAIIEFDLPPGTASLRVAMNGEDNSVGKNDFDLAVFHGALTQNNQPVCNENETGQFAFCNIERPNSGLWTIAVTRKKGQGEAQITAIAVTGSQ